MINSFQELLSWNVLSSRAEVHFRRRGVREAATGGGEHTAALARLMGENDPQAFGSWLQDNYGVLFSDLENHGDLVTRISAHRAKLEPIGSQDNA